MQYVDATDVLKTRQDCQPKTFDIYNYMVDNFNNYGCINDFMSMNRMQSSFIFVLK